MCLRINPTERKIHFRENWLIFCGIRGEAVLILGICEARQNTFRELRIFFRDLGRSMHYFKGGREHRLPPGRPQERINPYKLGVFLWDIGKLNRPRSDAAKRGI